VGGVLWTFARLMQLCCNKSVGYCCEMLSDFSISLIKVRLRAHKLSSSHKPSSSIPSEAFPTLEVLVVDESSECIRDVKEEHTRVHLLSAFLRAKDPIDKRERSEFPR